MITEGFIKHIWCQLFLIHSSCIFIVREANMQGGLALGHTLSGRHEIQTRVLLFLILSSQSLYTAPSQHAGVWVGDPWCMNYCRIMEVDVAKLKGWCQHI